MLEFVRAPLGSYSRQNRTEQNTRRRRRRGSRIVVVVCQWSAVGGGY